MIQAEAHEDANIIFGTVVDESMGDEIRITVIATGFETAESRGQGQTSHRSATSGGGATSPFPPSSGMKNPPTSPARSRSTRPKMKAIRIWRSPRFSGGRRIEYEPRRKIEEPKMSWKQKKRCLDLLAGEEGWSRKVWGESLTVCLAYPNLYRTGMSNLGFQAVYALINRHPACLCERVFLPEPGDEALSDDGAPLISIESQRPLADFDMVAFSLSFENDYPQILRMLEMAGIPIEAADRGREDPLVIGGGIAVTLNPEPLADFFDLFLLGEGEAVLPGFLDLAASLPRDLPREAFLARIQKEIAGAYVPRFYRVTTGEDGRITAREPVDPAFPRRIARPWAADLDAFRDRTGHHHHGDRVRRHVSHGGQPGMPAGLPFLRRRLRLPAGAFPERRGAGALLPAGSRKGKNIGLLGTAVSDHPALLPLCRSILDAGGAVAVGSLRLDRFERRNGGAPQGNRRGDRLPRPRGRLPAPPGCDPQGDHRRGDFFRSGKTHGM